MQTSSNAIEHPEQGAVTVETAMVLPFVVFLLALLIALGSAITTSVSASESARIVARAIAAGEDEGSARSIGLQNSPGADISISHAGNMVSVQVTKSVVGIGTLLSRGHWVVSGKAVTMSETGLLGNIGGGA